MNEGDAVGSRGKILVVDDSASARATLREFLAESGFDAATAADGLEALRFLSTYGPDLVLLDIGMPSMDGWEVLRRIRETHAASALPVIMVTGLDSGDDVARALRDGANDYVTKPIDLVAAVARIETQLALKHAIARSAALQCDLEKQNRALAEANARMHRDLQAAAHVQQSLLPHSLPAIPGASFAWSFRPCDELGGDFLNIIPLSDSHVVFYIIDVSGHGVPAALLAVTLSRFLSPAGADSLVHRVNAAGVSQPRAPAAVAQELNSRFLNSIDAEQFFTLLYGVLDVRTRVVTLVSAGHPGPVLLRGGDAIDLTRPCIPIGQDAEAEFSEREIALRAGDRLVLYSDGVIEARNDSGSAFGIEGVLTTLRESRHATLTEGLEAIVARAEKWLGRPFDDDVSMLALEAT